MFQEIKDSENKEIKNTYLFGIIMAIIFLIVTILDIIIGTSLGGNLSMLPQTAIDRFTQFRENWLLGLYNLDILNMINQIIMIPVFFTLYIIHKKTKNIYSLFSLIIFLVASIIFISNNVALPMLELSHKYFNATTDFQRILISAAGESLLIKGAHGSYGAFIGFFLSGIANIMISFVMLKGKIFNKTTSYFGIIGNILISVYVVLITFIPESKNIAMAISAPGGILIIVWMVMFIIKLFKLNNNKEIIS